MSKMAGKCEVRPSRKAAKEFGASRLKPELLFADRHTYSVALRFSAAYQSSVHHAQPYKLFRRHW